MTKLMEWLISGFVLTGIWQAVVLGFDYSSLDIKYQYAIVWFPILALFIFAIYAVAVVLYRVFTFNNCEEAAAELQEQIKLAVLDLTANGIKLKTK